MRSRTRIAVLMIVGLVPMADAAPSARREDPRELEAMRIAALRGLLESERVAPTRPELPKGSPFCLGFDHDRDATPRMLAQLADPAYVLKPLSECERGGLLYKPDGYITGYYNKVVVGAISRTSSTAADVDSDAFGMRCTVQIVRVGKEWAPRRTLGPVQPRVYIGCIS